MPDWLTTIFSDLKGLKKLAPTCCLTILVIFLLPKQFMGLDVSFLQSGNVGLCLLAALIFCSFLSLQLLAECGWHEWQECRRKCKEKEEVERKIAQKIEQFNALATPERELLFRAYGSTSGNILSEDDDPIVTKMVKYKCLDRIGWAGTLELGKSYYSLSQPLRELMQKMPDKFQRPD